MIYGESRRGRGTARASAPGVSPGRCREGRGRRRARYRPRPSVPPEEHRAAAAGGRQSPGRPSPGQGEPLAAEHERLRRCSWIPSPAGVFPRVGDRRTLRGDTRSAACLAAAERCPAGRCAPPLWPCCRGQRSSDPPRRRKAAGRPSFQQHGVPSRAVMTVMILESAIALPWPCCVRSTGKGACLASVRVCSLAVGALLSPAVRVCGSRLTAVTLTKHPDTVRGSSRALLVERGLYRVEFTTPAPSSRWV